MIVSDSGFIIATPTKCGTTTLEELCRRHRGGRQGTPVDSFRIMDWERPRRQHAMAMPSELRDHDRYMMVRNPYERWCSVYEYLRAPHNYSKWGAKQVQGAHWRGVWKYGEKERTQLPMDFGQFLRFIVLERRGYAERRWDMRRGPLETPFHYRSPWVWLDRLDESFTKLRKQPGKGGRRSVGMLRMESLWENMAWLKETYGVEDLSVRATIHANRCLTYGGDTAGSPRFWLGVKMCRAHQISDEWGVCASNVARCGTCVACRLGVDYEARCAGYQVGKEWCNALFRAR